MKEISDYYILIELNLKMQRQGTRDHRSRVVKSTDLKRRLFEVGLQSNQSTTTLPIFKAINSPKRNLMAKHPLSINLKQQPQRMLKYQPSHSPQLSKTHSKDFQIRKSPKQLASPTIKYQQAITLSSFYKSDRVKGDSKQIKQMLYAYRDKEQLQDKCIDEISTQSKLDQYVNLVLRGVEHIDEFLYLVRGTSENIYQLEQVDFQKIKDHQGENNFEYYTVSKKGFCQYMGGKPQTFIDIVEWSQEKHLYMKIKALKFFFRFRRWKTLQMWRRTITRQRRESISHNLQQKLYILQPTTRRTLLQLRKLTLQMEKSVLIIARNQGAYTLQSFKHCQERARREASLAVQEYSRQSRAVVRKCFENRLSQLRQNMKKPAAEQKVVAPTTNLGTQSPKEGAFHALGFSSKMNYEHRSRLRKEAGKFLRFSYLIDSIHLTCLAGLYSNQVSSFIARLEQLQLQEPVKLRQTIEESKDENQEERMFVLQLTCNFKDVPDRLISQSAQNDEWTPSKDIRLKGSERGIKKWADRLCQYWISLQPNLDEVLDELSFLLRQGLGSLKCFERWARHRQMQRYVSILEQWDDLVSQNWQISQNDNLDPLLLLDSIDPALFKLKTILKNTEKKLQQVIRNILTFLLNSYWQYSQLDLQKLQSHELFNPADSFEQFLNHTNKLLGKVTNQLPHRIELGVISVQVTRVKNTLGQKFAEILQSLKNRLPQLVEERTTILNQWLNLYGSKLREEILNIDDFVKIVKVIKEIQEHFGERREECNQLAQLYQTMQQFKMDTRRRKDFQTVTLKLKDQLDQLLITAEQNIERKADLYTKEVQKYHLPSLVKDITKTLQNVQHPKFLRLDSPRETILRDLQLLQIREAQLIEQRNKCQNYMGALKLQSQHIGELDQLTKQISSRALLWKNLEEWEILNHNYQKCIAKNLPLLQIIGQVQKYRNNILKLEQKLPTNEVLTHLKQSIHIYHVYLPLLNGFSQTLSDSHWDQIYQTLPQKFAFDLRKRQFTLIEFLKCGVGSYARQIQLIFEKCRVEAKLQKEYQQLEDDWIALIAKTKPEGKFTIISNGQSLKEDLNKLLFALASMLSNPHAQSLKQFTITYDSLFAYQEGLELWLRVQDKLVETEKHCRLLDIKKLADYNYFENSQRLYKQISKLMMTKGAQSGVRLGKLLNVGIQQKLSEIQLNLAKVETNIKGILKQHRRIFPNFYLFTDTELIKLITEPSLQTIEATAKQLIPVISHLQYQNERITVIVTIDNDRLSKNPISTNSQIQQILYQITETTSQLHRRMLKNCRYKAVENNLSSLVDQYNIQHLLAISRVDFSHYTTISIQNQQDNPDSLSQFRKVMRRDTAEDIKNRPNQKDSNCGTELNFTDRGQLRTKTHKQTINYLYKYDTLLLQQLLYEQTLDFLIKSQIQRAEQFTWASQLKFFWEDTTSDEPNITVRQLHLSLKYGNDFVGSKAKVIIQNEVQAFVGLKCSDVVVYNGSFYTLQRLMNAIGYKMLPLSCNSLTTQLNLRRFFIGCYFADFVPVLNLADMLPSKLLSSLPTQKWVQQFRLSCLKKNSPYLKEVEKNNSLFLRLTDTRIGWQSLQGSMRVVTYVSPKKQMLKCNLKFVGKFTEQRTNFLLRIFEAVLFLQQKSEMQGVSLQEFLDSLINQQEELNEHVIFFKILLYLKPMVSIQTHNALTKHIELLALLLFDQSKVQEKNNKIKSVFQCLSLRRILILTGRGLSKKHFIQNQLAKKNIKMVEFYGEILNEKQIFQYNKDQGNQKSTTIIQQYLKNNEEQKILYFQGVTSNLLQGFQQLLYSNEVLKHQLFKSKISIIIDIPNIDKFVNPRAVGSFAIINFESSRQYSISIINQWLNLNCSEENMKALSKILFEIILPSIQTLASKDQLQIEDKVTFFLHFLTTLLPFSNLMQACLYSLIMLFKGSEQQQIKLQYIVKKHYGEDKITEDTKINQLVYQKNNIDQGLVTEGLFMKKWLEDGDYIVDSTEYVITPDLVHALVASRRIHQSTQLAVILEGKGNSGKSTFLNLYRRVHHQNSFFILIRPVQGPNWSNKLFLTLQRHGLTTLGARINYKQQIILIDDLHMADPKSLTSLQQMISYNRCKYQQKQYGLKDTKFILSTQRTSSFDSINKKCLKLVLNLGQDKLKSIFNSYLKQNLNKQWDLQQLFINKITNSSYDLCKKIIDEDEGQMKESFLAIRRILSAFNKLKIKEGTNTQKQVEKFWSFLLFQSLKTYDRRGQLQEELKNLDLSSYNSTSLSYTHLTSKQTERRIQSLKDPKRLFNMLNEKIQKYNEGDVKRYGENFDFLNFESILQKIVTISHSILMDNDHLLVGRKGSGKQTLTKLCAYFNGLIYKPAGQNIKSTIIEIVDTNLMMAHLLYKKIDNHKDQLDVEQYYFCDFQSQILNHNGEKPKISNRQKQKIGNIKATNKNVSSNESFSYPKVKLSWQEVTAFKKGFRLVLSLTDRNQIKDLNFQVRSRVHIDLIDEVPVASILQYNKKLLVDDEVECSQKSKQLITSIFQYSRGNLSLSLRANDDCLRLFSSYLSNLVTEMTTEAEKYRKVLILLRQLKNSCANITQEVNQLHDKLKELSLQSESSKEMKSQIQGKLREKSTALSIGEKLAEILSWLQPSYKQKQNSIMRYLQNKEQLQLSFSITSSYFIYLSGMCFEKRRQILNQWYKNIPMLKYLKPIQSFLPLFLLYEEQFNAQPVDNLPEFYENMSIIFHNAKPIAIQDRTNRGRYWLEKNCSFLYLRENQKEFYQLLSQYLGKSTNILVEVVEQSTMDKLIDSSIGTLLFLPEAVNKINIKGQEVQIHNQAKVYLLLGQGVVIPKHLRQQFTLVVYDQSEQLVKSALVHEYLICTQKEHQFSKLEWQRKIRSLKLDCDNFIGQIAESIYEQLCGSAPPPQEKELAQKLGKITDKLMIKAQNQFSKIRQKQDLIKDFYEKYQRSEQKLNKEGALQFYKIAVKIRQIFGHMSRTKTLKKYKVPTYQSFFNILKAALAKGIITNALSLIISVLRQWGPMYTKNDYVIFAFLLVIAAKGGDIAQFINNLGLDDQILTSGNLIKYLGRQNRLIYKQQEIEDNVIQTLIDMFRQQQFVSLGQMSAIKDSLYLPLAWQSNDNRDQSNQFERLKIVRIKSSLSIAEVRQKIMIYHPRILEPTAEDTLQSLLKKNVNNEQVQILFFNHQSINENEKIIKNWFLTQKTIVFLYDNSQTQNYSCKERQYWQFELQNQQNVFVKIMEFYKNKKLEELEGSNKDESLINAQISIQLNTSFSHTENHLQNLLTDKYMQLIEKFINCIKLQYEKLYLPIPIFKQNQLLLIRKTIQNNDNPLSLNQKILSMLRSIQSVIRPPINNLKIYISTTIQKLSKLSQRLLENQFFVEANTLLAEGNQYQSNKNQKAMKLIELELVWLLNTRKLFGIQNKPIIDKYVRQINSFDNICLVYTETPKVARGSKRQGNLKNRRESVSRRSGRQSSMGKRQPKKSSPSIVKTSHSPLASLILAKQAQYYEQILYRIHTQLTNARIQIKNAQNSKPSQKTIEILFNIMKGQPTPHWRLLFAEVGCANHSLNTAIRSIITRRNQLFTYQNKFNVSETCQLEFKYIKQPQFFLRSFFKSELTSQDSFILTTLLTVEETERGQYLRINGMWGLGWRLSSEGVIETVSQNKPIALNSCYIVKKSSLALGVPLSPIELHLSPESQSPIMKIFGISKKSLAANITNKLFLKCDT